MYMSLQTVCHCHGYLLFESLHCDRCRSLIPFQLSDESLLEPVTTNNITESIPVDNQGKPPPGMLVPYRKQQKQATTTGRVRFRCLCPFCNSTTFIARYFCKRERLYYHIRIQQAGEGDQSIYRSIAETQNMISIDQYGIKRDPMDGSVMETADDSYSVSGSTSQTATSTLVYDSNGMPTARDSQIDHEKNLHNLGELEGDFFSVLRNGLFYDTLIQCQDDVRLQVHRCVLGGRSAWFRHLIAEYHESNTNDDYVLQISIDDIQSDVMNEILNFMYTNRCMVTLKNAPDLLISAKRFELEKLKKQIVDFLLFRLTVDNAIEMLICAHESDAEALKLACIRLINRHAEKIKRTEKWRTFKTQYVDLVPELYENRVEHPTPAPPAFLPDVFTGPQFPSESLRSLSQLYENPVQQRLQSPAARVLPPPMKHTQPQSILKNGSLFHQHPPMGEIPLGTYPQRSDSDLSSMIDRDSPLRQRANTQPRQPILSPTKRTVLPNIRQNSDADVYRRPVNVHDRSHVMPSNSNQMRIPAPPTVARLTSPRKGVQARRNPLGADEQMTMTRVVSIEPAD